MRLSPPSFAPWACAGCIFLAEVAKPAPALAQIEPEAPSTAPSATAAPLGARTRLGVAAGVGFPAILNAGPRIQLIPELEIGATFGSVPSSSETFLVDEGDASLHLLGARSGPRGPLFLRAGLSHVSDRTSTMQSRDTFLPITIGYEWFFGSSFGVSLDSGLMVSLSHHKECFGNQWICFDFAPLVVPAMHAQLLAYF